MSPLETKAAGKIMERPMKDAEVIDLLEHLRQLQEKAHASALQQLELTKQLETAVKKARALHRIFLADQNDMGGEA